jgi:hypothetical protein
MIELTPPEPTLPEPPRGNPWTVWGTMTSAMLHVGVLVFFLWQPPPDRADAAPPPAIDVELVPPPEAVSASEQPANEPAEEASAATAPPAKTTSASAAETSPPETPSETPALKTASDATETSEPVRGSETSSAEMAQMAEGTAPSAPSPEPDVATLELGALRSAERFYLKAMLSVPSMAQARAMLETLPQKSGWRKPAILRPWARSAMPGRALSPTW